MKKAISTFTVIGRVAKNPTSHTARGSGNQYMILHVLNDEENGGRFEFYCGTEWVQKKVVNVHEGDIICVKGRLGVNVNSGTNGGEFHNVNLTAEDVQPIDGSAVPQAEYTSDGDPF